MGFVPFLLRCEKGLTRDFTWPRSWKWALSFTFVLTTLTRYYCVDSKRCDRSRAQSLDCNSPPLWYILPKPLRCCAFHTSGEKGGNPPTLGTTTNGVSWQAWIKGDHHVFHHLCILWFKKGFDSQLSTFVLRQISIFSIVGICLILCWNTL